jgi:hypothetical protein
VIAAKAGGMPAPTGAKDVDWLLLNSVQGKLATQVYRVDTRSGQPPASVCCFVAPLSPLSSDLFLVHERISAYYSQVLLRVL